MYLKRITLKNFRAYYGRQTMEFSPAISRSISIVAGNNGHGKTSLLTSLVWCLYGKLIEQVEDSYKKDIKDKVNYDAYRKDLVNRKAIEEKSPEMYVELEIGDFKLPFLIDQRNQSLQLTLTIRRSVLMILGGISEELSVSGSGVDNFAFESQQQMQKFILNYVLPVEMAKFYLFDAERVVQIAENFGSKEVQKQLSRNFEEIFGILKYVHVRNTLESIHDKIRREAAPLRIQSELKNIESQMAEAELAKDRLILQNSELEKSRETLSDERTQLLFNVSDTNSVTREEYEKVKRQHQIKSDELSQFKAKLGQAMADVPMLLMARRLNDFNSLIEAEVKYQKELQEVETQRRNLTRLHNQIEEELRKLNDQLLAQEQSEYISKTLMSRISETVYKALETQFVKSEEPLSKPRTNFRKDFSENDLEHFRRTLNKVMTGGGASYLSSLIKEKKKLDDEDIRLRARIKEMENRLEQPQTTDARIRIVELEEEVKKIDRELGTIEKDIEKISSDLSTLKYRRTKLLDDLDEAQKQQQKIDAIARLSQSLNRFIDAFKREKIDLVQRRATEMMRRVFHKENLLEQFQVKAEGSGIRIYIVDQKGQNRDYSEFSMGERQIIITALLHALIHESSFLFPVFVDSPLQKLDSLHTRGILENFYADLHTQTVLLPLLDRELKEDEFELIRHHIDCCYVITHDEGVSRFQSVEPSQLFATHRHLQTDSPAS